MSRPRCLDLCCCAGGAGTGYALAGFDVYGVDVDAQPNYPHPFHQGDALEVLARLARGERIPFLSRTGVVVWLGIDDFDFIHASPPCQTHSALTKGNRARDGWTDEHVDLVGRVRDFLLWLGLPYVIENVQGAPVRRDVVLCGLAFRLRVFRHRYFECGGWAAPTVPVCNGRSDHDGHRVGGWRHGVKYDGDMFAVYGEGGGKGTVAQWQQAMGIDWTADRRELAEAIPPAYTEFIGRQLLAALPALEAAA